MQQSRLQRPLTAAIANNQILRQRVPNIRPAPMRHEWFEKTVRSAARVNSNLSYTLTQLNRAQAQATSVEALAVVHNKLQEILSTSINFLIQIRKNLRSEFIAGIKTIKFPPKEPTATSNPTVSPIIIPDDDVMFVNPPTEPPIIVLPTIASTVSLSSGDKINETLGNNFRQSAGQFVPNQQGFLKVKSFSVLQNIPPECITIQDKVVNTENPLKNIREKKKDKSKRLENPYKLTFTSSDFDNPSLHLKHILSARVCLKKCLEIDEILKNRKENCSESISNC